jgi:hypothetical protein
MQTQYINALEIIEQHSGIDKSAAEAIALHYRQLGGYTIQLVEDQFRCDITVHKIPSENTTFQAKEVKS